VKNRPRGKKPELIHQLLFRKELVEHAHDQDWGRRMIKKSRKKARKRKEIEDGED
jgi:hypothetical protein